MTPQAASRPKSRDAALDQLGTAFKGTLAAIRRLRGRDTHRHGDLTFAQYHLLFGLAEHDELSAGELALAAELSPAATTQLLDTLTASDLVERTRSERDRRVVTCRLTPRGRELVTERRADFEQRWRAALADLSVAEIAVAATVLDRLRTLYEQIDSDAKP